MIAAQMAASNPELMQQGIRTAGSIGKTILVIMFLFWCMILCCCAYLCHKFVGNSDDDN